MAIQKILIDEFLQLAKQHPVLDVRSPGEYIHAHIPGAYNLPLFTDEERKAVGTAYKKQSRKTAIKIGLDYFGIKMRRMVEDAEHLISVLKTEKGIKKSRGSLQQTEPQTPHCVLVHCWRGGMRSAGVAWLLDLYGFKVYTLSGGYKAYRQWARIQFDKPYNLAILGGYTGSGKTLVLQELKNIDRHVIDLEALASHKGSAFGAMGENPQPAQEMFENLLAAQLAQLAAADERKEIFVEDESQRIGVLNIPTGFWNQMRSSPVLFLDIPFEDRLGYLTEEYGKFATEQLVNAIIRIKKRLGGLETKTAINYLLENNRRECFRILLTYYDKYYEKGLHNRQNLPALLNKIPCAGGDIKNNTQKLINEKTIAQ
jgi:tRNA 2-selenouridine synthase